MKTARFGAFEPDWSREPATLDQKPFLADRFSLRQDERDEAILTGKLPSHEQEHGRRGEVSLAGWLALMNL